MATLKNKFLLFLILFYGFGHILFSQDNEEIIKIGDKLPSFVITNGNKQINTAELQEKVVLITFFATWCPPCRKELPFLEKDIWSKYKNREDFEFMVIGREHDMAEIDIFAKGKFDLPFYPDKNRTLFAKFANSSIPRNFLINKKGVVIYKSIGFSAEEFEKLKKKLDAQLQ